MPFSQRGSLCICKIFLLGLAFFLMFPLAAYELKSQRFVPDQYYIGQRVRTVLQIEVLPGTVWPFATSLSISHNLPRNLDYRIYQLDIYPATLPNNYVIEVNYAVFVMELTRLDSFKVQDFTIGPITVPRALSSLEYNDNKGIQEQPVLESAILSLPWVDLSIALLIQFLVLMPILVFQMFRRLRRGLYHWYHNFLRHKPYRQFLRQLRVLQLTDNLSTQEYYRVLGSQIRHYLGQRTIYPCSACTTEELARLDLSNLFELKDELPELWQRVLTVLKVGDDFRFRQVLRKERQGGEDGIQVLLMDRKQKQKQLAILLRFVKILEKQFRLHGASYV